MEPSIGLEMVVSQRMGISRSYRRTQEMIWGLTPGLLLRHMLDT